MILERPHNPGSPQAVNVCTTVVSADLCVGCGVCAAVCPTHTLRIGWNEHGQYLPFDENNCRSGCHVCLDACPFLDQFDNEDTLAAARFSAHAGIRHTPETGYYLGAYAGCVSDADGRARGASGGIARWFLAALLRRGLVDRVIGVTATPDPERRFVFSVLETPDQALDSAKSAYYPVEMSGALETLLGRAGGYAVVGLPCFLKAILLAARHNQWLQSRIVLTVGLVCGHTKTKGFADYLIRKTGQNTRDAGPVSFREKDAAGRAIDYSFSVSANGRRNTLSYGAGYSVAYTTGQFKLRCCNYCDDVFAELADVAFMDAWLPEYVRDGRGTNLVITRSPLAESLLQSAAGAELELEPLDISRVIASQAGGLFQKRTLLAHGLYLAERAGAPLLRKRVEPRKPEWVVKRWLLAMERLRMASFRYMLQQQASPTGLELYEPAIRTYVRACFRWQWAFYTLHAYWQGLKRRLRRLLRRSGTGR